MEDFGLLRAKAALLLRKQAANDDQPLVAGSPGGYYGAALGTGTLGTLSMLAGRDVQNIHNQMQAWDRGMEGAREILARTKGAPSLAEAEQIFKSYAEGGRNVAQSRVLGVRAGNIMGAIRGALWLPRRATAWATEQGLLRGTPERYGAMYDVETQYRPMAEHYRKYSDPRTSDAWFRDHHVEKAIGTHNARELADPKIFTPQAMEILNNRGLNLQQKYDALAKVAPDAARIYRESVVGNVANNRYAVGEVGRLAGNRTTAISTPQLYNAHAGRHLPGVAKALNRFGLGSLAVTGVLAGLGTMAGGERRGGPSLAQQMRPEGGMPPPPPPAGDQTTFKDLIRRRAMFKQSADEDDAARPFQAAFGTGLTAGGLYNFGMGMHGVLNPERRIAVTYGTMPEIGEGHKAPGQSILRSLQADPRFRRYNIEALERDPHGNFPTLPAGRRYATTIDTGFGAHSPGNWGDFFNAPQAVHGRAAPTGLRSMTQLAYLTDHVHSDRSGFGSPFHYLPDHQQRHFLFYGPNADRVRRTAPNTVLHELGPGVSPALDQNAVRLITEGKHTREDVLGQIQKLVEQQAKGGDSYAAEQLAKLREINKDTKLITIAGAGRGDYTATRARELAEALAKDPQLAARAKIIAFQAGAYGGPTEQLLKDLPENVRRNVISLGKIMPQFQGEGAARTMAMHPYAQLQSLSDINFGATGTSGLHEQFLGKNIQVVPKEWGFHPENRDYINPGTIAERQDQLLRQRGLAADAKPNDWGGHMTRKQMHLDDFNAGNMQYAHGRPGVLVTDKPDEILGVLKDPKRLAELRQAAAQRAQQELGNYQQANQKMRDVIHQYAERGVNKMRMMSGMRAAGGAAATMVGVPMVLNAVTSHAAGGEQPGFADMVRQNRPQVSVQPPPQTAREVTRSRLLDTAKSTVSNFWQRMQQRYGGG